MIQQIKALCMLALLVCSSGALAYGSDAAVQQGATLNLGAMPHTPWLSITSISGNGNSASDHGSFSGTSLSGASIDITNHLNQAIYVSFGSSTIPSPPYCQIYSNHSENRFSSCSQNAVSSTSYHLFLSVSDGDYKSLDRMNLKACTASVKLAGSGHKQYLSIDSAPGLSLTISSWGIACS